jgi:hypothetical protein
MAALAAERDRMKAERDQLRLTAAFLGSRFVAEQSKLPGDIVAAYFGQHFEWNGDRLIAKLNGNPVIDPSTGDFASFDVALAEIVKKSPHRDAILRPDTRSQGPAGVNRPVWNGYLDPDVKPLSRAAFDGLNPREKMAFIKGGGKLVD